jgi:hypothetical protein
VHKQQKDVHMNKCDTAMVIMVSGLFDAQINTGLICQIPILRKLVIMFLKQAQHLVPQSF